MLCFIILAVPVIININLVLVSIVPVKVISQGKQFQESRTFSFDTYAVTLINEN